MDYTIVVSAGASEQAAMSYIALTLCCYIEYFMDQGKDVLIVYDDLPNTLLPKALFVVKTSTRT